MKFLKNFCLFLGMAVVAAGFVACSDDDDNGGGNGGGSASVGGTTYSAKYAYWESDGNSVSFAFSSYDMENPASLASAGTFSTLDITIATPSHVEALSELADGEYTGAVVGVAGKLTDANMKGFSGVLKVNFKKNGGKYTVSIPEQEVETFISDLRGEGEPQSTGTSKFSFNYTGTFKDMPEDY